MRSRMSSRSAAISLRESFGDRKIPDISRRITACVSCRKLKIKCHMTNNIPPCTRCKSRGTNCTLNKSLQTLLEGDASWKEAMEERMNALELLLHTKAKDTLDLPASSHPATISNAEESSSNRPGMATIESPDPVTLNLSCGLGGFPASSMTSLAFNGAMSNALPGVDLVSAQLVPTEILYDLFDYYKDNMDFQIHHILIDTDTFASIRRRSPILLSAICTVAAFSSGSDYYEKFVKRFKLEAAGKLFLDSYTFDDVRALCLGALWLPDVSNSLNGLAVRIATDLDLHRCISKMPHVKKECYDRTRLYLLVYLCDHQCSISRGKPPLTRDFQELKSPREFLKSKFSNPSDLQLISQVELWSISSRIFGLFGADVDNVPSNERLAEIPQFDRAYENWRHEWASLLHDESLSILSRVLFKKSYHSGKLYLFSHVFRGRAAHNPEPPAYCLINVDQLEHHALQNALSIICVFGDESGINLQRLPCYFQSVTAFASVCLIKAVNKGTSIVCENDGRDLNDHLRSLGGAVRSSSVASSSRPALCGIADTIEAALNGVSQSEQTAHPDLGWNGAFGFEFTFDGSDAFTRDALHLGCDSIDPSALSAFDVN